MVNVLIHGAIADQIAAANKIAITDGERDALLKSSNLAPLLDVPQGRPVAYDVADQQIVARQAGRRGLPGGRRQGVGDPQPALRRARSRPRRRSSATSRVARQTGRHPDAVAPAWPTAPSWSDWSR